MGRRRKMNPYRNQASEYIDNGLLPIDRDLWILAIVMGRFSPHQAIRLLERGGTSRATVERHLKRLYDAGVLLRYRPPRDRKEGTHPFVYQLSPKALKIMEKAEWYVDMRDNLKKMPTGNTTHLMHRLAANDAVVEFMRLRSSDKRPKGFRRGYFDVWLAQDAAEKVQLNLLEDELANHMMLRPDAMMEVYLDLEASDGAAEKNACVTERVPIYLEVDRGTEKLGQIRRQMNYYIAAYLSDQWRDRKSQFPIVCWIFEKAKRAEETADLMDWVMRDFRDPTVRSSLHGWTEIETDYKLAFFNTCVTTKAAFYGAQSIAKDRIWRTNRSRERLSLEEIAVIRSDGIEEFEEERRLKEAALEHMRESREKALEEASQNTT